jgi:hypothetical protein
MCVKLVPHRWFLSASKVIFFHMCIGNQLNSDLDLGKKMGQKTYFLSPETFKETTKNRAIESKILESTWRAYIKIPYQIVLSELAEGWVYIDLMEFFSGLYSVRQIDTLLLWIWVKYITVTRSTVAAVSIVHQLKRYIVTFSAVDLPPSLYAHIGIVSLLYE